MTVGRPLLVLSTVAMALFAGCTVHTTVDAGGTAPATATHLWVTVQEIWLTTKPDATLQMPAEWTVVKLDAPVSVDLAAMSPGSWTQLLASKPVPAGEYRQLHLQLADASDPLLAAATSAGLTYNAQIDFTDSGGALTSAPLELPVPQAGLTIPMDVALSGSWSLTSVATASSTNSTNSASTATTASASTTASDTSSGSVNSSGSGKSTALAVTIDAARTVLSYALGSTNAYLLEPLTQVTDESQSGAISGSIDSSQLAAMHAPVFVSAQVVDPTQTHHVIVQRRLVGADNHFLLYPLPAPSKVSSKYDIVITCADAQSVIVRDVPVTAGSSAAATVMQQAPVMLMPASSASANVATDSAQLPAGARVDFYQTVNANAELPYLIEGSALDVLQRQFSPSALALSRGALMSGNYAGGSAIDFSSAAPVEGLGGYRVGSEGLYRSDTLAAQTVAVTGTAAAPTAVAAPYPALIAGAQSGRVTLSLTAPDRYRDSGFAVLCSGGRIIEAADVGAQLKAGGGDVVFGDIPAGHVPANSSGIVYHVAVRAWNSADPVDSIARVAAASSLILGNPATATLSIHID